MSFGSSTLPAADAPRRDQIPLAATKLEELAKGLTAMAVELEKRLSGHLRPTPPKEVETGATQRDPAPTASPLAQRLNGIGAELRGACACLNDLLQRFDA